MSRLYSVIRRPIITEKSTMLKEFDNQVVLEVSRDANKHQIREAVEKLFGVDVKKVNTMNVPGKPKRFGRYFGRRRSWKKAIVTLHEDEDLDFFEASMPTTYESEDMEGAQV